MLCVKRFPSSLTYVCLDLTCRLRRPVGHVAICEELYFRQ